MPAWIKEGKVHAMGMGEELQFLKSTLLIFVWVFSKYVVVSLSFSKFSQFR